MNDQPYISGEKSSRVYPLQDYLPAYQAGIAASWVGDTIPPAGWILCPFGSSPQIALEAAQAGYRVLLPVHNPILRFLIENLASPPTWEELNSALAALASSYKGKERLKPFILSLYETNCPQCGAKTSADSFRWSRNTRELLSKTCRCEACGEETQTPATAEDLAKAREFSDRSPIHARALTRVSSPTDPIRVHVENALGSYPPRSVYALFSVLNKLTGSDLPQEERTLLEILLLHAFYRCSHALPGTPKKSQKDLDPEEDPIIERNVWFALEDALEYWPGQPDQAATTLWPEAPPQEGGICLFPGRVKELIPQLGGSPIAGMLMVFPKPTPSFWGLSALWTGWLWGQEAAAPLRGVLSVRNYDWNWMTRAVESTLAELKTVLPDSLPILGLIPEADSRHLVSAASAGLSAGLKLENIALDPDQGLVQTQWETQSRIPPVENRTTRELIRKAAFESLREAGEPLHDLLLHAAGMSDLAQAGYPHSDPAVGSEDYFPRLELDFEENIAYRQGFLHYPEVECWWHLELELDPLPLCDRIEISLVTLLIKAEGSLPEKEILGNLYQQYPGLSTPRSGIIQACLRSYADQNSRQPLIWALKSNDQPVSRIRDLQEMEQVLRKIGDELGYRTGEAPAPDNTVHLIWQEGKTVRDSFFISASGLLHKVITASGVAGERKWIILPGSRAPLIDYKMNHNPLLAERIRAEWHLVKFRHLRRLAEQGDLTRENFQERFDLDPFTSDSRQLLLI
ncbi:MAG: hypothetical protein ACK2TT_01345 [Anaerolineales bacterium]